VTKAGDHLLKMIAAYSNYLAVEASHAFKVTVVDPCDAPVGITPSTLTDQDYYTTDSTSY